MLVAVLGFWWLQWQAAPGDGLVAGGRGAWSTIEHDDD